MYRGENFELPNAQPCCRYKVTVTFTHNTLFPRTSVHEPKCGSVKIVHDAEDRFQSNMHRNAQIFQNSRSPEYSMHHKNTIERVAYQGPTNIRRPLLYVYSPGIPGQRN